jgi:hypothetical protein
MATCVPVFLPDFRQRADLPGIDPGTMFGYMTTSLLARLKTYLFPGGDSAACAMPGIRTTQSGEIRAAATSAWRPFVAEETVDAMRSAFCWEATLGTGLTSVQVTDAYEHGHGRLLVRKGPLTLAHLTGPDVDQGELQRYLSYAVYCPSIVVNNPALDFAAVGLNTLRIRDRDGPPDAWVDVDLADDGRPIVMRAVRPMTVGRRVVPTEWSATGAGAIEWRGLRICRRLEASWHPPEGTFVYIRLNVSSVRESASDDAEKSSSHSATADRGIA